MTSTMPDLRAAPLGEPKPIIPPLASFYSHARELSWLIVRLTAGGMLLVHGVVKLALVAGLATDQLWSYPAAIVVFTGFTIYQMYQLAHHSSLFLEVITVLDVVVVLLVIAEYRHASGSRKAEV